MVRKPEKSIVFFAIATASCTSYSETTYVTYDKYNSQVSCADEQGAITVVGVEGGVCGIPANAKQSCSIINYNGDRVQLKPVKCVLINK